MKTKSKQYCHECQLKRGGKMPKHGHSGITVWSDICDNCKKLGTIVPDSDYDWPKKGKKAVFD